MTQSASPPAPAPALASRPGPLHARHLAAGARMGDFAGWSMPLEHPGGGVRREHAAVREAVGVFDVSHLGKVAVRGPGARAVVDEVLTNDTRRLAPGRSQYSLCCEQDGGVVDDLLVYLRAGGQGQEAEDLLLVPNAANAAAVAQRLTAAAGRRPGTSVDDEHLRHAVLAVQGPRCDAVLDAVGLPAGLEPGAFLDTTWRGVPVLVARTGYTGERGYELLPGWDDAEELWDALLVAVAAQGGAPAGLAARDTLRTEAGYPLHGHELGRDTSPLAARLAWAIGWDKEVFTGREALVAERAAGVSCRLWGLLATGRGVPRPGMAVRDPLADPAAVLGTTTSGTFSPTLQTGIALALLDTAVAAGDELVVDVRGRPLPVRVVRPPFVPDRSRA